MGDTMGTVTAFIFKIFQESFPWFRAFLPLLVKGILIFGAGWILSGWIRKGGIRMGIKAGWDTAVAEYLGKTLQYVIIVIFFIAAVNKMGFPVNSLLATIGVSGVIIGLGVRAEMANFFAGIMMLAARPFKKGDLIEFGPPPQIGTVQEVSMMYTALDTPDNIRIIVPNAVIWRNRIYNFNIHRQRAVKIPVLVPYEIHKDWIRHLLLEVAEMHEGVLKEPSPSATLSDLTGGGVKGILTVWFDNAACSQIKDLIPQLRQQFETVGIVATIPAADVDVKREE